MTEPIIETKLGKVVGRVVHTIKDFPYYSFQGMRYAEPPLGHLRFKAPKPAKPWEGVWNAQKEGNRSLSFSTDGELVGDEDCLFINVYTPELPSETTKPLPVMFWIHGGGYYLGSGNTDLHSPDYMIDQEVVIVTFNYRLGALGYMTFKDPRIGAPGNAAFKDMVMALKWVRDNILFFNGDPNNVTVWGQSAGGIAAHLLCVSPMAKGLFHRAIIQSGTGFVGFATQNHIDGVPFLSAQFAGLETKDEFEAYEYLRDLPKEKVISDFIECLNWSKKHYEGLVGPCIEVRNGDEEPFIDQDVELYYLQKRINAVPVIIGCNSSDGMVYATKEHPDGYIPPNFEDAQCTVPLELELRIGSDKCIAFGNEIAKFYYGAETPSRRNLDKYVKYQTDVKYNMRIKRAVQLHQYATKLPIYVYRFDFESPQNLYKRLFNIKIPGVCHGDELTYLWHTKYPFRIRPGTAEERVQHRMITLWTNFAKTSDPNPVIPDSLINIKWHPAENNNVNHLVFGKYLAYKLETPEQVRMNFWDQLYKNHYRHRYYEIFGEDIDANLLEKIDVQVRLLKYAHLSEKEKQFGFGVRPNNWR